MQKRGKPPAPAKPSPVCRGEIVRARGLNLRLRNVNMSRLRFAVLFAASSFGVILLAASASSSRPPAVYGAGDEWRAAPASNDDGTHQTLSKWAMRHRFYVGDVLDFKGSNDTVLLVRQLGDYERCSAASPPARRFADGGGDTRFMLGHPGLFYFISVEPARCEAEQRMVVRAVDALRSSLGGGAGAPTPAPVPAPGSEVPSNDLTPDPPSNDPPIPVWFKLLVPALIGFVAGSFLAGVIMWLCVNLRRRARNR